MMTQMQRVGYLAHAETAAHQRKIAAAKTLIAQHPDYGVSVSWGKDSVVLLHLAASVLPDCPAINVRYTHWAERLADHDRVRDETLTTLPNVRYHESPTAGMWEMYEKHGVIGEDDERTRLITNDFNKGFQAAVWEAKEAVGINGCFIGMRAGESRNRALNIKMRGKEYTKANGDNICLPLAGWSGTDIWAYLVTHSLPYLRIYDYTVSSRDRQRSEIAMSSTIKQQLMIQGEFQAWRKCYPREYQAWIDRFPELGVI